MDDVDDDDVDSPLVCSVKAIFYIVVVHLRFISSFRTIRRLRLINLAMHLLFFALILLNLNMRRVSEVIPISAIVSFPL